MSPKAVAENIPNREEFFKKNNVRALYNNIRRNNICISLWGSQKEKKRRKAKKVNFKN